MFPFDGSLGSFKGFFHEYLVSLLGWKLLIYYCSFLLDIYVVIIIEWLLFMSVLLNGCYFLGVFLISPFNSKGQVSTKSTYVIDDK